MTSLKKNDLIFLDGIRGLAALYVLIHHARLLLTQPFYEGFIKNQDKYNLIDKLMVYFFSSFKYGHYAVLIFFVLSGFVIHLKQAGKNKKILKISDFYAKRILRIYPTLIVSFLLTFCCAAIPYYFLTKPLVDFNLYNFLYNLFLIPQSPIWGNNYPVWSLKHEWYFYILYPVLQWTAKSHYFYSLSIPIILNITFAFGINIPFIGEANMTILYWWLGAGLAELYKSEFLSHKLIYFSAPFIVAIYFVNEKNLTSIFFCLITICFLAFLIKKPSSRLSFFLRKFTFLGNFSFSIYLLHFPIQSLIQVLYLNYYKSLPYHLYLVILGIIVPFPIIYVIYLFSEKKVVEYKNKFYK